jgi:solute carrier family 34 (sodium-dependent phosphate cotransporter)
MTLGSNIGTTVTGILTAFTQPAAALKKSMQLAFVYTLFNMLGVIFWLPIPFLRFPKSLAKGLGGIVFKYRWFLYCYVTTVYFIGPLFIFALALAPNYIALAIFGIPFILFMLIVLILVILQKKFPNVLPSKFRNFNFLPIWLRSLEPLDKKMKKIKCCCSKKENNDDLHHSEFTIPNVIRRLSAIEGLVNEGINYSRRNSVLSKIDSISSNESNEKTISEKETRF